MPSEIEKAPSYEKFLEESEEESEIFEKNLCDLVHPLRYLIENCQTNEPGKHSYHQIFAMLDKKINKNHLVSVSELKQIF